MTAAAFINADILRRLADDARPVPAGDAFAAEFGRDPSNFRKTLKLLESDALVIRPTGQPAAITDLGRQTLRGIDVAEGRATAGDAPVPTVWPVDKIRPNPANRTISDTSIEEMADAILGFGGIIQPLTLTPPDTNGVRMILAGERRWRGVLRIITRDVEAHNENVLEGSPVFFNPDLPPSLDDGVPFVEREATDTEALLITVVENTAREDLTPLDDAYLLLKLAEATGWSGAEVARRTGRQSETKKNGAKDVQDKLKIAREATPEALTEYRRTGSWDDLRNSVRQRREPEADPDQLPMFEEGEEAFRLYTVADFGVPADWKAFDLDRAAAWLEPGTPEILRCQDGRTSATIYVAQLRGGACWLNGTAHDTASSGHSSTMNGVWHAREPAYTSRERAIQAAAAHLAASYGGKLSKRIREWLGDPQTMTGPHVVNGVDYLNASRAQEARYAQGIDKRPQANSGHARDPFAPGIGSQILGSKFNEDSDRSPLAGAGADPSPRARVALVELAWKIDGYPELLGPTAEADPVWGEDTFANYRTFGAKIGAYWKDPAFAELDKLGYVRAIHRPGRAPLAQITDQGVAWFAVTLISIPPRAGEVAGARANATMAVPGGASTFVTDWLENEAKPAASSEADPAPQLAGDDWDRSADQIASDTALLADVLTLYHADDEEPDEDAARNLMQRLDVTAPFNEDSDGSLFAQIGGRSALLAIIDPDCAIPDDRSRAVALLIAWACRVVFGDDTSAPATNGQVSAPDNPAVPIRKSITADFLICLEDGRKFKALKRHLRTRYNLSPEDYRERWGLPADYPMQAPNYTRAREELAQRMGLGMAEQGE